MRRKCIRLKSSLIITQRVYKSAYSNYKKLQQFGEIKQQKRVIKYVFSYPLNRLLKKICFFIGFNIETVSFLWSGAFSNHYLYLFPDHPITFNSIRVAFVIQKSQIIVATLPV